MESGLLIKKMAVFGSKAFDVVLFVILWIAGFIFLLCVLPIVPLRRVPIISFLFFIFEETSMCV